MEAYITLKQYICLSHEVIIPQPSNILSTFKYYIKLILLHLKSESPRTKITITYIFIN